MHRMDDGHKEGFRLMQYRQIPLDFDMSVKS